SSDNAFDVLGQYDIVVDGSDNFPVRYLVNDATQMLGKPLVYGSIFQFDGQASVFLPGQETPCFRCLFPEPPPPGTVPSCAEGGGGRTVGEVLDDLEQRFPGIKERIVAGGGDLHRFVNVYVNEEDVRYLGSLEAEVREGDTVSILPAVAGGSA